MAKLAGLLDQVGEAPATIGEQAPEVSLVAVQRHKLGARLLQLTLQAAADAGHVGGELNGHTRGPLLPGLRVDLQKFNALLEQRNPRGDYAESRGLLVELLGQAL